MAFRVFRAGLFFLCIIGVMVSSFGCSNMINQMGEVTSDASITVSIPSINERKTILLYLAPTVPSSLVNLITLPQNYALTDDPALADVTLDVTLKSEADITWVYVLVGPFPTVTDDISFSEVQSLWRGGETEMPLLVTPTTANALTKVWGEANNDSVTLVAESEIQDLTYTSRPSYAIVPFEELNPRWKVIGIDGQSPIHKDLDLSVYPLIIHFSLEGKQDAVTEIEQDIASGKVDIPRTNFDPEKMTVILLTGTTALVRSTAERMESKGLDYPGEKIRDWLIEPDITHVSNEASFTQNCPDPNPDVISTQFCSKPEYMDLLDYVGVDVAEQTGNHLLNYGAAGMEYSLGLYAEHGIQTYGGGRNAGEARQPLLMERNGTKIAFLGCNNAGVALELATADGPGAAACDFDWMEGEIRRLKQEGYVVIVTLQDLEGYSMMPMSWVRDDFVRMAEAGADIVSGSQAHFPQGFEFTGNTFMHFGLGNLFFDQMDYPVTGTRREFLDRYILYDQKVISIDLLTAMLEDYAQPRPMTLEERQQFLQDYFTASGW
jgi:hypothetical protein